MTKEPPTTARERAAEIEAAAEAWRIREESALGVMLRGGPLLFGPTDVGTGDRICENTDGQAWLSTLHRLERGLDVIKVGAPRPAYTLTPKGRARADEIRRKAWFARRLAATTAKENRP